MNVKFETIPEYRIAYVRQTGPYGPANRQAMEKLKQWAGEKKLLTESAILFGIPQDNPDTTPPANCRYDACIVLSPDFPIGDGMCECTLPGGKYAIIQIRHTAEDVQRAWADLFPALRGGGYQMDNKPILERYIGELLDHDLCELCVPVKAL
jgi:DNA gyrase inhibitor